MSRRTDASHANSRIHEPSAARGALVKAPGASQNNDHKPLEASPAQARSKSVATATNQQHAIPLALSVVAWSGRLGPADLESQVSVHQRRTCICAKTDTVQADSLTACSFCEEVRIQEVDHRSRAHCDRITTSPRTLVNLSTQSRIQSMVLDFHPSE